MDQSLCHCRVTCFYLILLAGWATTRPLALGQESAPAIVASATGLIPVVLDELGNWATSAPVPLPSLVLQPDERVRDLVLTDQAGAVLLSTGRILRLDEQAPGSGPTARPDTVALAIAPSGERLYGLTARGEITGEGPGLPPWVPTPGRPPVFPETARAVRIAVLPDESGATIVGATGWLESVGRAPRLPPLRMANRVADTHWIRLPGGPPVLRILDTRGQVFIVSATGTQALAPPQDIVARRLLTHPGGGFYVLQTAGFLYPFEGAPELPHATLGSGLACAAALLSPDGVARLARILRPVRVSVAVPRDPQCTWQPSVAVPIHFEETDPVATATLGLSFPSRLLDAQRVRPASGWRAVMVARPGGIVMVKLEEAGRAFGGPRYMLGAGMVSLATPAILHFGILAAGTGMIALQEAALDLLGADGISEQRTQGAGEPQRVTIAERPTRVRLTWADWEVWPVGAVRPATVSLVDASGVRGLRFDVVYDASAVAFVRGEIDRQLAAQEPLATGLFDGPSEITPGRLMDQAVGILGRGPGYRGTVPWACLWWRKLNAAPPAFRCEQAVMIDERGQRIAVESVSGSP